jgi:DNA-binding NarL/FixJ family response regulator
MKENEKKIIIADPQFLTSKALQTVLKEKYYIDGVYINKTDLVDAVVEDRPDLIILDYSLLESFNANELKNLRGQVTNILVIANKLTPTELSKINEACIDNVLLKNTDEFELFTAVETCLRGKRYYSAEILTQIIDKSQKKNSLGESSQLTPSELEIVRLIAEGLTTKQIAARKFLSFHTVMTHRKNIFRKTDVKSVSELVMLAVKAGWIDNIEYYI